MKYQSDYLESNDPKTVIVQEKPVSISSNVSSSAGVPLDVQKDKASKPNPRPTFANGYKPLFELIKESGNSDAAKIKGQIDAMREKRRVLIDQIKRVKSRINYKLSEAETIARMLQMNQLEKNYEENMRKVRELSRQKRRLEFRISTDTFSLADEKGLVMKVKAIDKEMDEAYRVVRFFRKRDFIKKDLEEYNKELTRLNTEIEVYDKQLDVMYADLRKLLHINTRRSSNDERGGRGFEHRSGYQRKREDQKPVPVEVNLEDIVVFKKKPVKE